MYEDGTVREVYKVLGDPEQDFKSEHNLSLHFRSIDQVAVEEYETKVLNWLNIPNSSSSLRSSVVFSMQEEAHRDENVEVDGAGDKLEHTNAEPNGSKVQPVSYETLSSNPAIKLGDILSTVAKAKVLECLLFSTNTNLLLI